MTRIYFVRHGETEWNQKNRYCGRSDVPLNEKGVSQAQATGKWLRNIQLDAVYCSTLKRARQTADLITTYHEGIQITEDERLVEADFGEWEGRVKEEFTANDPKRWQQWYESPENTKAGGTGETATKIFRRVNDSICHISNKHEEETVLIVAHNTIFRIFIAGSLGMPLRHYRRLSSYNGALTIFEMSHGENFQLEHLNLIP